MIVRPAEQRGYADHGWLRSYHSFSFADYHDPKHMGFRALRVINEDRVAGGQGFGAHPHQDMEIISYVLEGELAHKDSTGTSAVIRPGEVQRMSAGTGVVHSEFNHSAEKPVHFLQIWILPERRGISPSYEQKAFPAAERQDRWRLVASRDGREGSLSLNQDVNLYAGLFSTGRTDRLELPRYAWLQLARGEAEVNGQRLRAGDGAAFEPGELLELHATEELEALLFDLA